MNTLLCRTVAVLMAVSMTLGASTAAADRPHDLDLSQLLEWEAEDQENIPEEYEDRIWGRAQGVEDDFRDLTHDLGAATAPRPTAPSDTLGQAGFAVNLMSSVSVVPADENYWQRGANNPSSAFFSNHLQVRKGLPMSLEIVGNLSHLARSQMFTMGADLRFALHEGYRYFPDIGARGSVNTITGAPELNLINAAWDVSLSKGFGIGGVTELTPYMGFQQLYTIASTRVLNARPEDPRPPQTVTVDGGPNLNFAPEYVFEQRTLTSNRFFGGLRLNTWIMSFTFETIIGERTQQFTFAGGVDF